MRLLQEAGTEALERAAGDAELLGRAAAIEAIVQADLARPAAGPPARHRRSPGGLLLRRVRHPRLAAHLLRRARRAGRRHAQGGLRPRAAARRRRAAVPPGLLPPAHRRLRLAARVLGRHRPRRAARGARAPARTAAADRHRPVLGPRRRRPVWRVDVGRVPLFLLDADRPENRASTAGSPRGSTSATRDMRLAQYALLGIGGMRALQALGIDPASSTSTRATPRSPPRAGPRGGRRRRLARTTRRRPRASARSSPPTRRYRPATTPTRPRSPRSARPLAGDSGSSRRARPPGPHAPGRPAEAFGLTPLALRSAATSTASADATARWPARCGSRCGPAARRRRADRARHQRRAPPDLDGRADARLLDRHLGAGWMGRADRPRDLGRVDGSPTRSCGPRALSSGRARRPGARAQRRRPAGPRRQLDYVAAAAAR